MHEVFPWVHHLTIVWLIYLISSLNCFLASGLLTFCSKFQEVTAHQSVCITEVQTAVGLGCQFSNLKSRKRQHIKPELTVPWRMTTQLSVKWHSGIKPVYFWDPKWGSYEMAILLYPCAHWGYQKSECLTSEIFSLLGSLLPF